MIGPRSVTAAVLALAMSLAAPGLAAKESGKKEKEPEKPAGPTAHLVVSTHHGYQPLTITLTGTLTGVDATDPDYCHAAIEWEASSPSGVSTVSRQDPKCLHPPEQVAVQFTFNKTVTLDYAGLYNYRFIVYRRDGSKLISAAQEVRVLAFP
ncbi:MAG: hypothetical protein ACREAA_11475 [Candidatus Polarisedimenticolia bacterium]